MGTAGVLRVDAQRPTVRPQLLDVVDVQAVGAQDLHDRREGEVREVLVVDRVVLEPVQQAKKMRKLERRRAVVTEEQLHPGDEVVEVWNLCEDIVAQDEAGALALVGEPLRALAAKELDQRRHTPLLGGLRDVGGRVDPENLNVGADKVLE
jgi:hypothetical protein